MKRRILAGTLVLILVTGLCTGCQNSQGVQSTEQTAVEQEDAVAVQGKQETGISIHFQADGIQADASQVTVEGNVVTITQAGTYVLTGTTSNGRVVVEVGKEEDVELVLNGVDITCPDYAPIRVTQAGDVTIDLAEGSVNILSDGSSYQLTDEEDNTDGVIFSKDDLKLKGDGTLYINGNYKHGIVGKDDVEIKGGIYIIQAVEDGINANDSITIEDGTFTVSVGDDGMHVDELFTINNGTITITESTEGLEGHQVIINNGMIDITASDDGINSNNGSDSESSETATGDLEGNESTDEQTSEFSGGFTISENGMMPDRMTPPEMWSDGTMPEGMTPPEMSEDGGMPEMPEDGMMPEVIEPEEVPQLQEGQAGRQPDGGRMQFDSQNQGMPEGMGMMMDADEESLIQICGGTITVDAGGDGLDSNGYLKLEGGTVRVSGAMNDGDSAIDYGIEGTTSGGTLIATGFSGMATSLSRSSTQYNVMHRTQETQAAGTQIVVKDSQGQEILSWTPKKEFNNIILSFPELEEDEEYTIEFDGNAETLMI
ncbi:MAG: carbohydrate-binding domain-containing protein [Lachnospiraceae bacterium]|nr:carbohydrate-binding domain-containing protein [Lachnospiraceae bacterium]